jgi:hypothetical protein
MQRPWIGAALGGLAPSRSTRELGDVRTATDPYAVFGRLNQEYPVVDRLASDPDWADAGGSEGDRPTVAADISRTVAVGRLGADRLEGRRYPSCTPTATDANEPANGEPMGRWAGADTSLRRTQPRCGRP